MWLHYMGFLPVSSNCTLPASRDNPRAFGAAPFDKGEFFATAGSGHCFPACLVQGTWFSPERSRKFLSSSLAGRTAAGMGPLRMKKPVIEVWRKLP